MLNVVNGPMATKATNEGSEYERQINRLDCFFYVKGALDNCVYYQKIVNNTAVIGQQEIPFYVDETVINTIFPSGTECDVFVIANYPGSGDWTTTYENTSVESLKNIVLELFEQETDGSYKHDAVDKPFVMSGFHIATKGDNNNATGTIPMVRAASKITISVKIPEWIEVTEITGDSSEGNTTTTPTKVKYYPHLENDSEGKIPLRTAFHHGVSKTYLNNDYNSQLVEGDYFSSPMTAYKNLVFTAGADASTAGYYTCEIEVPFYSYARTWAKGDVDAPYLTLQMPWEKTVDGEDVLDTYYYQILVNAGGLALSPNTWYDYTVNVGVLGSLIESLPTEIKSDDITYYLLDWTKEPSQDEGDRYEDVVIKEYMYLMVPEKEIVINNSTTGYIPYDASHAISWVMNTTGSKTCDILPNATVPVAYSSFYVNCGGSSPAFTKLSVSESNFSLDANKPGYLKYEYEIPEDVYSPVYVYVTITMTVGDKTFSENVRIVQYPAIYIIPDQSTSRSVYVNENQGSTNVSFGTSTKLGSAKGTSSDGDYMYVINVSSFDADDYFSLESGSKYEYVIGDPRVTEIDNEMKFGGSNSGFSSYWATAPATYPDNINYTPERELKYYYPTSKEGDAFKVIAPKYRIVSFLSTVGGATNVTDDGAALRCASYQEDGFPAGRWRLPTAAEIQFIVELQSKVAIVPIFVGGTNYFCNIEGATVSVKNGYKTGVTSGSVRCVYDEWYWGSERDAKPNGTSYLFTWGDEPRR